MKRILWALAGIVGVVGLVAVMRYHPKPAQIGSGNVVARASNSPTPAAAGVVAAGGTPTPAATATPAIPSSGKAKTTPTPAATTVPSGGDNGGGTTATPTPTPHSTPTPTPSGQYHNGTYTGTTFNNVYGPVQVQAVVSGGQITGVNFLQMPSGGNSDTVTAQAKPILLQETLSAQSANVNTVSGATQTSGSYRSSLASALAQAS